MNRLLLFILIIVISFINTKAQQIVINNFSKNSESQLTLKSHFDINSTGLSNRFIKEVFIGNKIISENINKELNTLNSNNIAGYEFLIDGHYQKKLYDNNLSFYKIGLRNRQYNFVNYTDDLLGIVALGNSSFENKIAYLNSNYSTYNYQSLYLGLGKDFNDKLSIEIQLSAIVGSNYQELNIYNGDVFTAPYGEYIDGTLKGNYISKSDNELGFGGALSGIINYKLTDKTNLKIGFYDLGMVNWSNLNKISIDSSYHFDGFSIDNIFQSTSFNTSNLSLDSLNNFVGLKEETISLNKILPSTFFISVKYMLTNKSNLELGLQSLYTFKSPLIYSKYSYNFNESFIISPILAYGGFGGLNFGLSASKNISNRLLVDFESRFVDGAVLYNWKSGIGATFKMSYKI